MRVHRDEVIELAPQRIFIEAGGNLLVSGDDGVTWNRLVGVSSDGKPAVQTCPLTFTRVGERMVVGGECPLDWGWIGAGTLRPDLLGWSEDLRRYDLENRNVQSSAISATASSSRASKVRC